MPVKRAAVRIGISGYIYESWSGRFYPPSLIQRQRLEYASRIFDSIELNGTFYSLKSPSIFARWAAETPARFVFAIKGSRFITHNLKLRNCEAALGNFYASGVLALGRKTGPFLWQLPSSYAFQPDRIEGFLSMLPKSSREAEAVAARHDHRVRDPLCESAVAVKYRHAMEVRHESYFVPEFYEILERHGVGFVVSDTAGRFPYAEVVTAPFVYVRLHGSKRLYVSGYDEEELDSWSQRLCAWRDQGNDVYVYFDNDAKVHAPHDAMALMRRVHGRACGVPKGHEPPADRVARGRAPELAASTPKKRASRAPLLRVDEVRGIWPLPARRASR
jgi:uncharacterized protein YecE (DUF72 family)